jgi:hypothetical protein
MSRHLIVAAFAATMLCGSALAQDAATPAPAAEAQAGAASTGEGMASPSDIEALTDITTVTMMSAESMPAAGAGASGAGAGSGGAADAETEAMRAAIEGNADLLEALEDEGWQVEDVVGVQIGDGGAVTIYHTNPN